MIDEAILNAALERRKTLCDLLRTEGTDCYRLFHGATEGSPGLSIDRYGPLIFAQVSAKLDPSRSQIEKLAGLLQERLGGISAIARRRGPTLEKLWESAPDVWSAVYWVREFNLEYAIQPKSARRDLQLFLDARALKRRLSDLITRRVETQLNILNLFSYTCSIGCLAAQMGATRVWNVDFSDGNLNWGRKNVRRNRLPKDKLAFISADAIAVLWAITGVGKGTAKTVASLPDLKKFTFDIVLADPPPLARGRFATVDMRRDPETVIVPAWRAVAPGGHLIVTNNAPDITLQEFAARLRRALQKAPLGHRCLRLEWLRPDSDFPSFDGHPPLKVAICHKEGHSDADLGPNASAQEL